MSELQRLTAARKLLEDWILAGDYAGWDPFDALRSPVLSALTFGSRRLGQVWVQLLKRSPVNLRPLLRITPANDATAMGLFLSGYLSKAQTTGSSVDLEHAGFFASWLAANHIPRFHGYCWGFPFDWPNRESIARIGTPTIVNTAFVGLSLLDASEVAAGWRGQDAPSMEPLLAGATLARSACEFILADLNPGAEAESFCFWYTPSDSSRVHNANVLGASLLAKVGYRIGDSRLCEYALRAARYTARHQGENGEWLYGEAGKYRWVDSFHTGYVLVALKQISRALAIKEFDDVLARGYRYWKGSFLQPNGCVSYYPNHRYPIDAHSLSQAILTLIEFSDWDSQALEHAWRVANWSILQMQDRLGFFYYQKMPLWTNKIPYNRWSQAWMFRALTALEARLQPLDAPEIAV